MKLCKKILIAMITLWMGQPFIQAQPNEGRDYPEIGKPCPDFVLNGIKYFSKKEASLKDFKGKWLILDFFSTGCATCFESFPKVNRLAKDFEGKIQYMLVGRDDKYIRPSYERFRQHFNLQLPVAYDTILFKKFGINTVPHVLWIDEKGIVRAITSSPELKAENIQAFLVGKSPNLAVKLNKWQTEKIESLYDYNKPLLVNGNGGNDSDFLYRSLLTKWNKDLGDWTGSHINSRWQNKVQLVGIDLFSIYFSFYYFAYGDTVSPFPSYVRPNEPEEPSAYGKFWPKPVLEIRDSSLFQSDYSTGENRYSYSLIVPPEKASPKYLQSVMQRDLKDYFGYEVKVETRRMPCWKLTASEDAKIKLKTKGGPFVWETATAYSDVTLKNVPVKALICLLWAYNQMEPPFVDATGITGNIDIKIDAVMTDFNDVKKALRKNGLDLVKGEKEMKVIVIRDGKGSL